MEEMVNATNTDAAAEVKSSIMEQNAECRKVFFP